MTAHIASDPKKIKLIICDMDGTLLSGSRQISGYTVETLNALRRKGLLVTLATGRIYRQMADMLSIVSPDRYVVTANGAVVTDLCTGEDVLSMSYLSSHRFCDFLALCDQLGIDYSATSATECWLSHEGRRSELQSRGNARMKAAGYAEFPFHIMNGDFSMMEGKPLLKTVFQHTDESDVERVRRLLDGTELEMVSTDVGYYEVIRRGVTKRLGCQKLADTLGLAPEECCAIGDYDSDLPLFGWAGISIAMKNAPDYVREKADVVTKQDMDSNGAALELRRLFLD